MQQCRDMRDAIRLFWYNIVICIAAGVRGWRGVNRRPIPYPDPATRLGPDRVPVYIGGNRTAASADSARAVPGSKGRGTEDAGEAGRGAGRSRMFVFH